MSFTSIHLISLLPFLHLTYAIPNCDAPVLSFLSDLSPSPLLISPLHSTPLLSSPLVLPQIKLKAEHMAVDGDFLVGLKEQG